MNPQIRMIVLVAGVLFILSGLFEMGLGERTQGWIPDDLNLDRVILLTAAVVLLGWAGWAVFKRRKHKDEEEE